MTQAADNETVLFGLTGVGVVETDLESGRLLRANQAFCEMVGYSEAELQGMSYLELTDPEDRERDAERFAALQQRERQTWRSLTRVRHKDGRVVWLELNIIVLGKGNQAKNLTVATDVTGRVSSEAALHESEAQLAVELADAQQLQRISSVMIEEDDADALYEQILEAARVMMRSDFASIQMLVHERNELLLLNHIGFAPESAEHWKWVSLAETTSCGVAMSSDERIIIPDAEAWDLIVGTEDLEHYRLSGIRAMQSTQLVSRSGRLIGMISTHWRDVHEPSARELRLFDVLARQVADLIERRQTAEALREREERYRSLFGSIDQGFCISELLYDENGRVVDFCYLEVNGVFERQTGLADVAGKLQSELAPNTESHWFETYARVARTGESIRFETYTETVDRWFSVFASRVGGDGSRQLTVVFDDITERKRRERNLAFLADIENRFASLASSEEIIKIAGVLIGEHFDVSHCLLVDINEQMSVASVFHDHRATPDLPSLIGDYQLENFHSAAEIEQLAAGQPVVINDVSRERNQLESGEKFDALGTRALVTAPYVRDGRWKFAIGAQVNQPRQWRVDETEFLTELATRVALRIERARAEEALRASEERLSLTVESIPNYAIFTTDLDRVITSWNTGAEGVFGYSEAEAVGQPAKMLFTPEDQAAGVPEQEFEQARAEGAADDDRWHLHKDGSRFYVSGRVAPLRERERLTGYVKIARDLTKEKQAEAEREMLLEAVQDFNTALEGRVTERTAELERSNVRFTQAFELAPISATISTLGKGETFLEVNEAFLKLTGYTREEVLGKTAFDLKMWSFLDDQKKLQAAQKDGLGFRDLELKLRHKQGAVYDILLSAEVIKVDEQEGYLKMFYDITSRKRSETQMHTAVQSIMTDARWFSQEFVARLNHIETGGTVDSYQPVSGLSLSPRERELLSYLAMGWSNQKIGEEMGLKQQTVRNYISTIYEKLGIHSRAEAIVWAREHGLAGK